MNARAALLVIDISIHGPAPLEGERLIVKTASDCFHETPLQEEPRRLGVTHLVVSGMQTGFCVDTTRRRAISLGLDVTLASDAHTPSTRRFPGPAAT